MLHEKRTTADQPVSLEGHLPRLDAAISSPFRMVAEGCGNGDCPTVYEKDGDPCYYVQGYDLSADDLRHLHPSAGESVVRIPKALIEELIRRQA
jgi:hypothetical protein